MLQLASLGNNLVSERRCPFEPWQVRTLNRKTAMTRPLVATLLACLALSAGCSTRAANPSLPVPTAGNPTTISPQATGPSETPTSTTFAIIGDYGVANGHERAVANLVASWHPAYVIAVGDDYYSPAGGTGTGKYDNSTGAFYGAWIGRALATTAAPPGQRAVNGFFPALGNHDYSDATPSPETYLTYFTLPGAGFTNTSGNERYYDFLEGPVHFFVLNSNAEEPDGTSSTSKQARWLKAQLAASTSRWNIVYDHHPPYSSDSVHGSTVYMQWPFAQWGADAVISGHAHVYERVMRDNIAYFVNGLGGAARYGFSTPVAGSAVRYRADWGAQKATVTSSTLEFAFYDATGGLVDRYRLPAK